MRVTNDRQWPVRLDAGELGSFELGEREAESLAAELTNAIQELSRRRRKR